VNSVDLIVNYKWRISNYSVVPLFLCIVWLQKYPYPHHRGLGSLEIPRRGGLKAKFFKGKCGPKMEFQRGGGGFNPPPQKKEKLCGGSMVILLNNTLKFCKTLSGLIQLMFTLL